jgi:hypothetical protein
VINLATASISDIGNIAGSALVTGIAFSPQGTLFAVAVNESPFEQFLDTVNPMNATVTSSKPTGSALNIGDIDYAPDGYLYGTNFSWYLLRIDPTTGNETGVGFGNLGALGGIASLPTATTAGPAVTGLSPASGAAAGGTSVTITGTGFTGATAVDFGTTAASFTVNSATQITATSPAGTGTVNVTVVAPSGTSTISSVDQFSYVASPTFTLTGPASGTFAAGQTITVPWTAANVPSGSIISLAYDTTTNWGNPTWIEVDGVNGANGSGSYNWNTTGLAPGTYYIAGYLYTPSGNAVFAHLTTAFTVTAASSGATPAAAVSSPSPAIHDLALLDVLGPDGGA